MKSIPEALPKKNGHLTQLCFPTLNLLKNLDLMPKNIAIEHLIFEVTKFNSNSCSEPNKKLRDLGVTKFETARLADRLTGSFFNTDVDKIRKSIKKISHLTNMPMDKFKIKKVTFSIKNHGHVTFKKIEKRIPDKKNIKGHKPLHILGLASNDLDQKNRDKIFKRLNVWKSNCISKQEIVTTWLCNIER